MGNTQTSSANSLDCFSWEDVTKSITIINYSDQDLVITRPSCPPFILTTDKTVKGVSLASKLTIGNDSLFIRDIKSAIDDIKKCIDKNDYSPSFTLGNHYVHYHISGPSQYIYKIVRMAIPIDDVNDYGDLSQFGIDLRDHSVNCTCEKTTIKHDGTHIYNRSDKDIMIDCSYIKTGPKFKLRSKHRTCYSAKYRSYYMMEGTCNTEPLVTTIVGTNIIHN